MYRRNEINDGRECDVMAMSHVAAMAFQPTMVGKVRWLWELYNPRSSRRKSSSKDTTSHLFTPRTLVRRSILHYYSNYKISYLYHETAMSSSLSPCQSRTSSLSTLIHWHRSCLYNLPWSISIRCRGFIMLHIIHRLLHPSLYYYYYHESCSLSSIMYHLNTELSWSMSIVTSTFFFKFNSHFWISFCIFDIAFLSSLFLFSLSDSLLIFFVLWILFSFIIAGSSLERMEDFKEGSNVSTHVLTVNSVSHSISLHNWNVYKSIRDPFYSRCHEHVSYQWI